MSYLFQHKLLLVLGNTSKLIKNNVGKLSVVSKDFSEEILELSLCCLFFCFKITFILVLLLNYYSSEKQNDKKDLIESVSSCNFEMIFTLLTEPVAI